MKFVVEFLWKAHLKIAKLGVLPQRNCYFVCLDLPAKVSHFLFFSSSTTFAKFVEDIKCKGFARHSNIQVLQSFGKSCLQSLCV